MKIRPIFYRLAIKYGLIGALMAALAFLTFFYLDQQPWRNLISFILDSLLVSAFVLLAIRDFKVNHNQGELRFYHGMTIGVGTYVMAAFVFAAFQLMFMNIIEPGFLSLYIELAKEDMMNRQAMLVQSFDQNWFDESYKALDDMTKNRIAYMTFLKKLPVGLIVTPVFSIIMRTHQVNRGLNQ